MSLNGVISTLEQTIAEPADLNLDTLEMALRDDWQPIRLRLEEGPVSEMPGLTFVLGKENVTSEIPVSSGPGLVAFIKEKRNLLSDLPIDKGEVYRRVELLDCIPKEELNSVVTRLWKGTGLATGIVKMPREHEGVPQDEREFNKWRLTPVRGSSLFCKHIRDCSEGNKRCMWDDLGFAREAARNERTKVYRCHTGLIDMVTAIKVAGYHVANIYVGQAKPPNLNFEQVWENYNKLIKASQSKRHAVSKEELKSVFNSLPVKSQDEMLSLAELAQCVGNQLSKYATRKATLDALLVAKHRIGAIHNVQTGLHIMLDVALRLLHADSGSVFLLDIRRQKLVPYAMLWGGRFKNVEFDAWSSSGIIPSVITSQGIPVYCNTRQEMENFGPPVEAYSRDVRSIESIMAVPILQGDTIIGVLEVGSICQFAFTKDNLKILKIFSDEMAIFIKICNDRREIIKLFGEEDAKRLAKTLSKHMPQLVGGTACSIFIRNKKNQPFLLFASSEFKEDQIGELSYKPGEGLTGWVLASGRNMRISGGPKCRTSNMPVRYAGAKWVGKYHKYDPIRNREYYENRPWMGVPIKSSIGDIIGVIRIADKLVGNFSEDDETLIISCADYLARLIEAGLQIDDIKEDE